MHPRTKNEFQFEKWLFEQYGMTKKEERGYTLEGNLDSLWEIFSAADMVLFARGLPSIGKELAQLGKKAVDDVAEEAIEKTVKKEASEEMAESTAKKEVTDTTEDLSQKTVDKDDSSVIKEGRGYKLDTGKWNKGSFESAEDSLKRHFEKHGEEVGAKTPEEYLRKAEAFARIAKKGSTKSKVSGAVEGVIRYKKNGKYIDLAPDGSIISFGHQ